MATIEWRLPLLHLPQARQLLAAAATASKRNDLIKLQALTERIRQLPNFPRNLDPLHDTVVVTPITGVLVSPTPQLPPRPAE